MSVSAIKKPKQFQLLIDVLSKLTNTDKEDWLSLRDKIARINAASLMKQGFTGTKLGQALKETRISEIEKILHSLVG